MAPARRPIDNISMPAAAASASSAGDGPPLPPPSAPAGPSSSGPRAPGIDDAAGADARKKKLAMRQAKTRERKEPKEKGAAKGFVFIESDPSQKHSEDTRRSIRSHVMLGKNKTRQPRVKARQSSWIGANDKTGREQGPSSRETALQMRRNMTVSEGKNAEAVLRISPASPVAGPSGSSEEDEANSVILIRPSRGEPSVPPSICHDLRTFAFAEELSSDHISLLAKREPPRSSCPRCRLLSWPHLTFIIQQILQAFGKASIPFPGPSSTTRACNAGSTGRPRTPPTST